jgi:hypothetical protein
MQVGNPGGAVDVMRSTSRRRDATIKRLANLTDDYKIINISHTQGAENIFPGRRKRSDPRADQAQHLRPGVAMFDIVPSGNVRVGCSYKIRGRPRFDPLSLKAV